MKITGTQNVIAGREYQYTVTFDKALEKDKVLLISADDAVVYFSTDKKSWKAFIEVTCKQGSKSTTLTAFWIKEKKKTTLRVKDKSGMEYPVSLEIKIEVDKCTFSMKPENLVLWKDFLCTCTYPYNTDPKIHEIRPSWFYDQDFFRKTAEESKESNLCSIPLKPLKTGITKIGILVQMLDHTKNIIFSYCKNEIEVAIKSPYTLSMNNPVDFASIDSTLSYQIDGLINDPSMKEVISWHCSNNGKLISTQGARTASFKITSEGAYFTVYATITFNGETFKVDADKKVWIGKPTVAPNINRERNLEAGSELTLEINDFNHYTGDIGYTIESGMQDKFTIEALSSKTFKITSTHPLLSTDLLSIRFTASNPCGSVSSVYTIHVDGAPGSSFDKPLHLCTLSDHKVSCYKIYDLEEMVGDMLNFKIYFSFDLVRKADFYPLVAAIEKNEMPFKVYDANRKEVNSFVPTGEEPYSVVEVPAGIYYWVVDVNRTIQDTKLQVLVYGMVRGLYIHFPYIIDTKDENWEFHDTRDTTTYYQDFYYLDEQGQEIRTPEENNVHYCMTLKKRTPLLIHTNKSRTGTEIHILQGNPYDWKLLYHQRGNPDSILILEQDPDIPQDIREEITLNRTLFKRVFEPGEYKFVLNGSKQMNQDTHNGIICFNILPCNVKGTSLENPYELGRFTEREFRFTKQFPNIEIHRGLELDYVYFHFSFEKNVDLYIEAYQDNHKIPVEIYDSQKNKLEIHTSGIPDVTNTDFYGGAKIKGSTLNDLTIKLIGSFRGGHPDPGRPYSIGTHDTDFVFTDSVDTSIQREYKKFAYKDDTTGDYLIITPEANHIYYAIKLLRPMEVVLEMPGNYGYVEYHVMTGEAYDWKPIAQGNTYFTRKHILTMEAGEYTLVFNFIKLSNGSAWNGLINVHLEGKVIP